MINKIEFSARNLTSNAGLFLLLEQTDKNGFFVLINRDLVYDSVSTNTSDPHKVTNSNTSTL
ncbi:MAG: hypothetical protein JEZ06_21565 [Anaerolineaceae bacterium]|nr:hypothetical protein [Anaerolineaceae bacterium]